MSSEPIKNIYARAEETEFLSSELKELTGVVNNGLSRVDSQISDLTDAFEERLTDSNEELTGKLDALYDRIVYMRKEIDVLQESNALWKTVAITALCAAISSLAFLTVHIF